MKNLAFAAVHATSRDQTATTTPKTDSAVHQGPAAQTTNTVFVTHVVSESVSQQEAGIGHMLMAAS